ncbi:uncharacterized protein B4U79_13100 [Dinothrombium tinctorium]|uniref:Phosphatidylinositol-specific phospholipase C X domain-containing protein n=1 Tax=Dinothrombium tinctorium TaxID=1965070 RepID=A0A443QEI0_9ACAR|nr:uncharacterized protein B4U79_13100 [Dinothrombium tinctorium]
MLPGTHNSGSYFEGYKKRFVYNLIDKYTICQDENVFNQLAYGIRYIDLRVMYNPKEKDGKKYNFWIAHDTWRMNQTLESIFQQIKDFLDATKSEIVILDFHRFPKGFDTDALSKHEQIALLLETFFGDYLSPAFNEYRITVEELIQSNKRLVIGYGYDDLDKIYLYKRVRQIWADTDSVSDLHDYFKSNLCHTPSSFAEAAMAELTPKIVKVILDSYGGLRNLADLINPQLTRWFRDEWPHCANIIASDFFLGNNIIEISIEMNRRRK